MESVKTASRTYTVPLLSGTLIQDITWDSEKLPPQSYLVFLCIYIIYNTQYHNWVCVHIYKIYNIMFGFVIITTGRF